MATMSKIAGIDLAGLSSADPSVKYGCSREVLALAREDPAALYPERDAFVALLDSDNRILRWTAIGVVGALAKVDRSADIGAWVDRLIGFLNTDNMITANNAIAALADIALARPEYRPKITAELIRVEGYDYDTPECRNIAIGKAIMGMGVYFSGLDDKKTALDFVRRQAGNSRHATKKKAEQFLKKYDRQA
jgi:hypothetical protein